MKCGRFPDTCLAARPHLSQGQLQNATRQEKATSATCKPATQEPQPLVLSDSKTLKQHSSSGQKWLEHLSVSHTRAHTHTHTHTHMRSDPGLGQSPVLEHVESHGLDRPLCFLWRKELRLQIALERPDFQREGPKNRGLESLRRRAHGAQVGQLQGQILQPSRHSQLEKERNTLEILTRSWKSGGPPCKCICQRRRELL